MGIKERVMNRIPDEAVPIAVIDEYVSTISDRLCLRLGVDALPALFDSICVDAVVKMHRRKYYEGISSEGAANINTSFVDNILGEYEQEIADWKTAQQNLNGSGRKVRFL